MDALGQEEENSPLQKKSIKIEISCRPLWCRRKDLLSGGSNDRIVRNMLVNKKLEEYDLAVIEMTFPARTEYYSGITWKG